MPNIKQKGKKRSLTKFNYELTDINRRQGQLVEKKSTLRRIIKTNLLLGNIKLGEPVDTSKLLVTNDDLVYRLVSKERDYETQAVVFFVRDYSGSMEGKPTEAVTSQHLMIYSWLVYQYQYRVETRFVVHDTEAREVSNFTNYFQLQVAGGTRIEMCIRDRSGNSVIPQIKGNEETWEDIGETKYGPIWDLKPGEFQISAEKHKIGGTLVTKYDYINLFVHERGAHVEDFKGNVKAGLNPYFNSTRDISRFERNAIRMQVAHPSWGGTSLSLIHI